MKSSLGTSDDFFHFSNDGKLPFPYPRDSSGTSSVFVSSTTYTDTHISETFMNLTYLDSKVAHYDEISCVIKNKGGLCSRVNQHPTSLLTEKTPAYSYYARVTLVLSSMASAYSVLRQFVKWGLKCFRTSNTEDKKKGRFAEQSVTKLDDEVEIVAFDGLSKSRGTRNSWAINDAIPPKLGGTK